jgi:asparagine N-glycosylation enzyme membrane subunit Stt3
MSEKDLVELWNSKRSQLTAAQLHSVIALAVLAFLAVVGDLQIASMEAKLFAAVFLVTVGALGNLTQFAIIREAQSVVAELSKHENPGPVALIIAQSGRYLSMTLALMVAFSLVIIVGFALVVL